mgnify:CR=1 FL=1|tara:strand:- start:1030 stop:1269 length:240 start_codon:yes stop_codon:yes gene_type:complete
MKQFIKNLFTLSKDYEIHFSAVTENKIYAFVNGNYELVYEIGQDSSRIKFLCNKIRKNCIKWGVKPPEQINFKELCKQN